MSLNNRIIIPGSKFESLVSYELMTSGVVMMDQIWECSFMAETWRRQAVARKLGHKKVLRVAGNTSEEIQVFNRAEVR